MWPPEYRGRGAGASSTPVPSKITDATKHPPPNPGAPAANGKPSARGPNGAMTASSFEVLLCLVEARFDKSVNNLSVHPIVCERVIVGLNACAIDNQLPREVEQWEGVVVDPDVQHPANELQLEVVPGAVLLLEEALDRA